MANQKGLVSVIEESNSTNPDLSLKLMKSNNDSDDLAGKKPLLKDLSYVETKPEVSTNDSLCIKSEPAEINQDEDISMDLRQVIKQETLEHSLSQSETKVEIMYCCFCSHCDVDSDRLKIHLFRKHPNEAAVVTYTFNKVDCNFNDIRLFCVRETCTFSSTFCNVYEVHLMSCCPFQQSLSKGEMERLRSTLKFLLDSHHRHSLSAVSGFVDYVTCLSQSINVMNRMVDKSEMHGNASLSVKEQERKQESFTTMDSCTNTNLQSSVGEIALDHQSSIDHEVVSENISLEIDVAGLPIDTSPSKQMMEEDGMKGEISVMNGGNCYNNGFGVSDQQPGDNRFIPDECSKTSASIDLHQWNEDDNSKSLYTGDKPFQCNECCKTFTKKYNLTIHKRIHTKDKPFQCNECNTTFNRRSSLNRHKRIHTGNKKPFQCNECCGTFSQRSYLNIHKRIHTGDKPFQCNECDKTFRQRSNLTIHKRIHTRDKPFQCNECDKTFCRNGYLNIHKRIHSGDKPFQCNECDKTFSQRSNLTIHKRIHTRDKPFQCNECDKTFSRSDYLITHKRIHTGDKPFQCHECDKTFSQRYNLNNHKRIHTGDKPFQCNDCDKTFNVRSSLNRHKRIHTGYKPYQCNECDKTFRESGHLIKHKRIHTGDKPFKCDECDKTFRVRSHLNIHKRIHTEDKPFKCDECDKTFSHRGSLNVHKRIHTGDKPFKCDECDKTFRQRSHLIIHRRIQHVVGLHSADNAFQS